MENNIDFSTLNLVPNHLTNLSDTHGSLVDLGTLFGATRYEVSRELGLDGRVTKTDDCVSGISEWFLYARMGYSHTSRPTEFFRIPPDRVIKLGAEVEI